MSAVTANRPEWIFDLVERVYGRRPSNATVHRWKSRGLRGRKLRTVVVCGRIQCTESDLREFVEGPEAASPARVSDRLADRMQAQAMAELDEILG